MKKDGDANECSEFKGLRLFKQTIGSEIGVTIQFKFTPAGFVELKICALFESLLKRMLLPT